MLASVRTTTRRHEHPALGFSRSVLTLTVAVSIAGAACAGLGGPRPFPPPVDYLVDENQANGDVHGGRFPYEAAVRGLPEGKRLSVDITTSEGTIHCRLDTGRPLTVANFVGLARGLRPFRAADGTWVKEPYYDGSPWHRALVGEFVQAGRNAKTGGKGDNPGFRLQDESGPGQAFDRGGLLAMANRGAEHSGATQFFITTNPLPQLNGQYTIFGSCDDEHVVRELERQVAEGTQPAPVIRSIAVSRQ